MFRATGLRVILIGEESAAAQVLRLLASSGCQVAAVLSSGETNGRNASLTALAQRQGYRTWPATSARDPEFSEWIRSEKVDLIINVHSLYIVHERILRAPSIGAFNLHPGPLPEYAGLNTVSWAIYQGASSYGVTLHWMAAGIDTGDITAQSTFSLELNETPLGLMHKCVEHGLPMIQNLLESAARNPASIPRIPQDLTMRRLFGRAAPEGGRVNWANPAQQIVNFVRACDYFPFPSPWGHPATTIAGRDVELIKAVRSCQPCEEPPGTLGRCDESGVHVAAQDEWVVVQRLTAGGRLLRPLELLQPA